MNFQMKNQGKKVEKRKKISQYKRSIFNVFYNYIYNNDNINIYKFIKKQMKKCMHLFFKKIQLYMLN